MIRNIMAVKQGKRSDAEIFREKLINYTREMIPNFLMEVSCTPSSPKLSERKN
jgi:hypothetical protein